MKNLKNMLVASGLMVVFMIGASSVNAGVIVIMKAEEGTQTTGITQCTEDDTSFLGIILTDLKGLLVSDGPEAETSCEPETSLYGLLVSD